MCDRRVSHGVEGDSPDLFTRRGRRLDAQIDIGVIELLETVPLLRLAVLRQVERQPDPRLAAADDLVPVRRPVQGPGVPLGQAGRDPPRQEVLVGIHSVARAASGRVGVHVDQAREQQAIGVVEGPDGRAPHLGTGSHDAVAADGNASGAIELSVGTEHPAGGQEQVEGLVGVGHGSSTLWDGIERESAV